MAFVPTEEQIAILKHDYRKHARVLAGPGTGKSTTMVAFLDVLLREREELNAKILTFTRAATAELAEKVVSSSPKAGRPSTIHSFAISILLRNPGAGGFPEPLRIADGWESRNIVRPSLARICGGGLKKLDKLVHEMAANWQSLTDEVDREITDVDRQRFRGVWLEHRKVLGYTLLDELPYALRRALVQHESLTGLDMDILLVDEYQDLNACDLEILKLISQKTGCSVVAIGDDDQSIYSWRKAAPEGIRRFPSDYPGAKNYDLSITLRCGKRIIEWANHVIQGDPNRPSNRALLDPHQDAADGTVALLHFKNQSREAKGIAQIVKSLIEKDGMKASDIVILVRGDHNQAFSTPIKAALAQLQIPCSDPTAILAILEQDGNRQLIEHLRLLVDPSDSIAWASLVHYIDDVGVAFFDYIYDQAKSKGNSYAQELLLAHAENFAGAPGSARRVGPQMVSILSRLNEIDLPEQTPSQGWGSWILEQAGRGMLPTPTVELEVLLSSLDNVVEKESTLSRYLNQMEPLGKDLAQAHSEGVRFMTMGGSKGLTVRATIVAGVEDGLVPRPQSNMSEERRVLYVAMTRAKEVLICTWARRRTGPTARSGQATLALRRHSPFLDHGPVETQDGDKYVGAL